MRRVTPSSRAIAIAALILLSTLLLAGCAAPASTSTTTSAGPPPSTSTLSGDTTPGDSAPDDSAASHSAHSAIPAHIGNPSAEAIRLAEAAESQVGKTVIYDPAYVALDYPGGDVPLERGVCTDVVVRAFRALGTDLQVEVHKDMAAHFAAYPQRWGPAGPDRNIDHRRVPNLQTYFSRLGKEPSAGAGPEDYWPGDIVTWDLQGPPHIGIVSTKLAPGGRRHCVVHNIGAGAQVEDRLFDFAITGHYRPL